MTTDPKLLALAAQLAAAAGFAASAPGAPLVAAQAAGDAGPAPTGRAGPAGAQALVPALWNLDRLDQAAPPLDGLFRRARPRRAPGVGREAGGGALLGVPHPTRSLCGQAGRACHQAVRGLGEGFRRRLTGQGLARPQGWRRRRARRDGVRAGLGRARDAPRVRAVGRRRLARGLRVRARGRGGGRAAALPEALPRGSGARCRPGAGQRDPSVCAAPLVSYQQVRARRSILRIWGSGGAASTCVRRCVRSACRMSLNAPQPPTHAWSRQPHRPIHAMH